MGSETGQNAEIVAFQKMLTTAGFPEQQIIVLSSLQTDTKRQPTLRNIRDQLIWVRAADKPGPLPGQTAVRRNIDEACEVFVYLQMPGFMDDEKNAFLCPLDDRGRLLMPMSSDGVEPDQLLSTAELSAYFTKSEVERRFVIANISSPQSTRGSSGSTLGGVDSRSVLRRDSEPEQVSAVAVSLAQMVITDQISVRPGTVDSFIDILSQAAAGYADRQLQGNHDGKVTVREILDYTEHFGNMVSPGVVRVLLTGHDYSFALTTQDNRPSRRDATQTAEVLAAVGDELNQPSSQDRTEALESFNRAVERARIAAASTGAKDTAPPDLQRMLLRRAAFHIAEKRFLPAFADTKEAESHWELTLTGRGTLSTTSQGSVALPANTRLRVLDVTETGFRVETVSGTPRQGMLPLTTPGNISFR